MFISSSGIHSSVTRILVAALIVISVIAEFVQFAVTGAFSSLVQGNSNCTTTMMTSQVSVLDLLNSYSNFIIAVLTIFLVALTASTVRLTGKTIGEMRKATQAQFLPHLKPSLGMIGPVHIDLVIKNVGKGAAVNPIVKISLVEFKESSRSWKWPMLVPDEGVRLGIPTGPDKYETSNDFFKRNQSTLDFHAEYRDILGKSYTVTECIDITAHVKQWEKTMVMYKEDELEKIRRELEKISGELTFRPPHPTR